MKAIYNKETFTLSEVNEILYDFSNSEEMRHIIDSYYSGCIDNTTSELIQNNLDETEKIMSETER